MPVSTKVKCLNCGRLVNAADVTTTADDITHCPSCDAGPLPVREPIPLPEPEADHERPEVTEDIPATDAERRAGLQDATSLGASEPSGGTLVKVPAGGDDDPERTCGPVEIVEDDGMGRTFNEALPAPEVDQLRKRLQDALMRLVVLKETAEMITPATPELKILRKMIGQAIIKL